MRKTVIVLAAAAIAVTGFLVYNRKGAETTQAATSGAGAR